MLPMLIVGAAAVVAAIAIYLTLTHPHGLTGPSYRRAKKSILAPFVRRGRPRLLRGWLAGFKKSGAKK